MNTLVFDMGAVLRLAAITRRSEFHRPAHSMLTVPAYLTGGQIDLQKVPAHLLLVHRASEGVYLRSSAVSSDAVTHRVFADGLDGRRHPDWWRAARDLLGEPDTAEVIDLSWVDLAHRQNPAALTFGLQVVGDELVLALPVRGG